MIGRAFLSSLALQAFLTMVLASPTPKDAAGDVTWTITGPKEAVEAFGSPAEALGALGKAMQAKAASQPEKPSVEGRGKPDDFLMYYNA